MSIKQAIEALEKLIDYSSGQLCLHEDTYRGGAIWEICSQCGAKWADDEGGRSEWTEPKQIVEARAALAALRSMPAEPVTSAGRVTQLEAALQAAGDLAASSRSGPAKAESLQGIEKICTEALEHRGDRFLPFVPKVVHDIANEICQAVAELPDRNSPEDWPEAMLVTHDELRFIVAEALATPHTEAVRMSEAEERAAFEAAMVERAEAEGYERPLYVLDRNSLGNYATTWVRGAWIGWQARAVEQATAARLGVKMGDV